MRVSEITIKNVCSCYDLADFNAMAGDDNWGKSNILRVINWLLRKSVHTAPRFHDPTQPLLVTGVIGDRPFSVLSSNPQTADCASHYAASLCS